MKKILVRHFGLTPAKQAKDSNDLLLNCCDHKDCEHQMSSADDETLDEFCAMHQVGLNNLFYYQADTYRKGKLQMREQGIGRFLSDESGTRMTRDYVFFVDASAIGGLKDYTEEPHDFGDEAITIGFFVPDDIAIRYYFPNSIFTSEGTVLLEDGEILMADKDRGFIGGKAADVIEMIQKHKAGFQLPSVKPRKPKQGTVVFNKATKKFEGYDGKGWIEL